MKFTHLEYGRDHGPDHLHKGKLKTKKSFKMYFMVATICTRENLKNFSLLPPEAEIFFTTPKQFIL